MLFRVVCFLQKVLRDVLCCVCVARAAFVAATVARGLVLPTRRYTCILAEGAIALPVTLSGGVLFAS